jgi:hypothetical protein
LERGKAVFTTSHPNDEKILAFLRENYVCEEIRGPTGMSGILKIAAKFMPKEIYPLILYRVTGPALPESEIAPDLATPPESPPESVWEEDQ